MATYEERLATFTSTWPHTSPPPATSRPSQGWIYLRRQQVIFEYGSMYRILGPSARAFSSSPDCIRLKLSCEAQAAKATQKPTPRQQLSTRNIITAHSALHPSYPLAGY